MIYVAFASFLVSCLFHTNNFNDYSLQQVVKFDKLITSKPTLPLQDEAKYNELIHSYAYKNP